MERVFRYEANAEICGTLAGIITTPTDFDPEKEKLPVIVFLHGMGERGNGSEEELERLKCAGIPKYFCSDPDYKGLRVITMSPQCPVNMFWTHLIYPLMKWIRDAVKMLNGDEERIAITGLSMGGFGTWNMLCTFPETFCCGAPVCGGGVKVLGYSLGKEKIRAYHGVDDPIVSFEESVVMVEEARKRGADVELTAFDHVGHNSWDMAYGSTDLIEWLASCRLGGKE